MAATTDQSGVPRGTGEEPGLELVITGFGAFKSVSSNPTSILLTWVRSLAESNGLPARVRLVDATTVKVTRKAVWAAQTRYHGAANARTGAPQSAAVNAAGLEEARATYGSVDAEGCLPPVAPGWQRLFLHMGVATSR